MRRFSAVCAGVLVALAVVAAPAAAAIRWSPATVVAGESPTLDFGVLADSTAIAILTFHHAGMTPDHDTYDHSHVEASVRPPGGVFSVPRRMTGVDRESGGLQTNFGDDALLWIQSTDGDADGHPPDGLIPRPDGGDFRPAEPVPENSVFGGYFDERGDLTTTGGPFTGHPWLGVRRADGTWTQREVDPTYAGRTYAGDTIAEPDGTVTLIGRNRNDDIVTITAPPGGAFGPPEVVARAQHSSLGSYRMVHDARGDAMIAWTGGPKQGAFEYGTLHTAYRPAGGHWQAPKAVPGDPFGIGVEHVELAMDARGDAAIAWTFFQHVALSYRPAGGSWERATTAPDYAADGTSYPEVGIGANGDAVAVYPDVDTKGGVAVDHPAGLGWQPPEAFTQGSDRVLDQQVGVAADGAATVVWRWWADADHQGIRAATHRIEPAPPPGDAPPAVSDYRLSKPRTFAYRTSEKGRVEFLLRAAGTGSRRVVATFSATVGKGGHLTKLPDRVRRQLAAARRYRATIVAVDRSGQYSKQKTLVFSPAG